MKSLWSSLCCCSLIQSTLMTLAFSALLAHAGGRSYFYIGLTTGAGFMLLGFVLANRMSRSISEPFKILAEVSRLLARGNFKDAYIIASETPLRYKEFDFSFRKTIADLQQVEFRKVQTEKLNVTEEMLASITHSLLNPLTTISIFSSALLDEEPSADWRNQIHSIKGETQRCLQILEGLTYLGRVKKPEKKLLAVVPLLEEVVRRANDSFLSLGFEISYQFTAHPSVLADHSQLRQLFLQILMNTKDALAVASDWKRKDWKGKLAISVWENPRLATIQFVDNGCGIPSEYVPSVIHPFFTTKQNQSGMGLGLAMAAEIVKVHGGEMRVSSEEAAWTKVVIELPLATDQSSQAAAGLKTKKMPEDAGVNSSNATTAA